MKGAITIETVQKFLKKAMDVLEGDWILIGGTVLPCIGANHRVTLDIDLVGREAKDADTIRVMELAESLGLSPETINQAGSFFLRKIVGWEDHLVELRKGRKGVLYRPDTTLYLMLKMGRMSKNDLEDCLAFLRHAKDPMPLDKKKIFRFAKPLLTSGKRSKDSQGRLQSLLDHL